MVSLCVLSPLSEAPVKDRRSVSSSAEGHIAPFVGFYGSAPPSHIKRRPWSATSRTWKQTNLSHTFQFAHFRDSGALLLSDVVNVSSTSAYERKRSDRQRSGSFESRNKKKFCRQHGARQLCSGGLSCGGKWMLTGLSSAL